MGAAQMIVHAHGHIDGPGSLNLFSTSDAIPTQQFRVSALPKER